ncbi:MAG TPA: ATP-dependent 6-phosphofructokinase [Thermoleophilia bacterium]|nr:ATP-dependent 6-phosphofructokinase [Thermoleophilia bacterium]HQG55192.1 ATP-dependent 6-phosphofructokinase [Thermoleophilia bacterium]HQJ98453.1 ATP-dependent 6-phosphofructokinase [Thermoleophilia bacterium]
MAKGKKGRIGILTGGGDVPGLNPAIRAVTVRAIREGFEVVGIRRGWAGLVDLVRDAEADNSACVVPLDKDIVNHYARSGGTFLHSSRTRPSAVPARDVPAHLKSKYAAETNDLTDEVVANLDFLGIDYLIPVGGDDTLSYGVELGQRGVRLVAIPKTMDNDVPGTDYCIGFGTCVTRTINVVNQLKTSAASHERIMIVEVFGRYAGFTALLPTIAGAAHRCVIPEWKFDIDRLSEILVEDRNQNPDKFSVCLVSEGAMMEGGEMLFKGAEKDQYGHAKLGGIGDQVSALVKERAPAYNNGRKIDMISMDLGYTVRSGDPDALDSIVPMAFGNLAVDLVLRGDHGRMVALRNGRYDSVPIDTVVAYKKVVDVEKFYDTERYRPTYASFELQPMLVLGAAS